VYAGVRHSISFVQEGSCFSGRLHSSPASDEGEPDDCPWGSVNLSGSIQYSAVITKETSMTLNCWAFKGWKSKG